jgi:hypothetical protein
VQSMNLRTWGEFREVEPELAAFGATCFSRRPAYLATLRRNGVPRVHPVTPIISDQGLFLFMEPTSPKGGDLRARGSYALHNGVPDNEGSGGEFWVSGRGVAVENPDTWSIAAQASSYEPAERYLLFELLLNEARCNGYGDVALPPRLRWSAPFGADRAEQRE